MTLKGKLGSAWDYIKQKTASAASYVVEKGKSAVTWVANSPLTTPGLARIIANGRFNEEVVDPLRNAAERVTNTIKEHLPMGPIWPQNKGPNTIPVAPGAPDGGSPGPGALASSPVLVIAIVALVAVLVMR